MKYQYSISAEVFEKIPVIVVEGDLTSDADSDVKSTFSTLKSQHSMNEIIINFEKTKYINSSGIATLINIIQDVNERNGTIAFVGMSAHLKKVMDIVGISDFVQIHDTNDQASKSIKN